MSSVPLPVQAAGDLRPLTRAGWLGLTVRILRRPMGAASLGFLLLLVLAGAASDLLAGNDPDRASAVRILSRPGDPFLLGGDGSGHDIWSRLVHAIPRTLEGAALAVVVATVLGVAAGLVSGYYGRWFAGVSSWIASALMALPGIVVLLVARAILGPSLFGAMVVFGVLMSPAMYRVVHAAVAAVRHELFVDAARVSGLSDARIISRHIFTVVRAPTIILAANLAGIAIAIQAGLDFLGLGDLSQPTWGGMLNDAFGNIYSAPLNLLWPSLAVGLTCISLALLANALRDALERSAPAPARRRRPAVTAPQAVVGSEPAAVHDVHDELAEPAGEVVLEVRDLAVGHDQPDGSVSTVVHDVSLVVRRGEVHGLVGESGSGKTQTAFAVLRLLPAGGRIIGGSVCFEGADLAHVSGREMARLRGARIAYVPQEPMSNLDPAFTIGAQLVEPMRVHLGIGRREARDRALSLLARVGMPDPGRAFASYPHEISGGMAQRALIAGAVSCEPDLLIADEPTTALDVTVQAEVLDLLRDLQAELDLGVLLVTHDFGVVADLCDRVSVMQAGRVVETGPTLSVFEQPHHPYTRSLLDAILDESLPRGGAA